MVAAAAWASGIHATPPVCANSFNALTSLCVSNQQAFTPPPPPSPPAHPATAAKARHLPRESSKGSGTHGKHDTINDFNLDQAFRTEQLWEEFFSDPSQWWDNRSERQINPRSPDFKHKITRKGLWIGYRLNPPWVKDRLRGILPCPGPGRAGKIEQLWQDFFLDPSQWWDNRFIKKTTTYPDFRHKVSSEGLWIDGTLNPSWVKRKIAAMESSQIESGNRIEISCDKLDELCQEGRWQELLQGVELMIQQNFQVPINVYASLLKWCTERKALEDGRQVHALIVQNGLDSNIFLQNTLVDMYAKCDSLLDARKIFDTMSEHNVFSWTAIILAYADHGQNKEAITMFQKMQEKGIAPDSVAYVVALKACANLQALEQGKQIHSQVEKRQFVADVTLATALVDMYAKCEEMGLARQIFDNMQERNLISWNAIIAGYSQQGHEEECFELYEQMKHEEVQPNNVTYALLAKACASIAALKQLHSNIITSGFESDVITGTTLLDMYAKLGSLEHARKVFDSMPERNVVSWNAIVAGYAQAGLGKEALDLYDQMKQENVEPDDCTYIALLKACASISALEQGKQIHSHIIKSQSGLNGIVGSALVDMYAKCGCMEDAYEVFNTMDERDVVSWSALIAGYAQKGLGQEALKLLTQMQREGIKPNEVTYLSVLAACSHSGLTDEGCQLFDMMCKDDGVKLAVDHYACMIDLLGRAGRLVDAEELIKQMPIQPDKVIWLSLLGAARNHGNVEIGKRAFDGVMKLEPGNGAAYVLLSNTYAAAGRIDEVANIRAQIEGLEPGSAQP